MKTMKSKLLVLVLAVVVAGIAGTAIFYYSSQSYLRLNGDDKVSIGLNGIYEEQGAEARSGGNDVSDSVKISGSIDTTKPGKYKLTYRSGNFTAERTVEVLDKMDPEIVLEGEQQMSMKLGETFKEPGYSAADSSGADLTSEVKVTGAELTKAGTQKIAYEVRDSNGGGTRVYRTVDVKANTDYDAPGLPICMYHYVYDENDPPEDLHQRFGNYISAQALEEELNWLNSQDYYYPTWKEVREYIDGKLLLPEKSIVLCFDDGARSFLDNGIPVLEKCKVPATCFMITSSDGKKKVAEYKSDYVYFESHSDNMHRPGGSIGHGGIFTAISETEGLADLKKSIEICGSGDAFAYPFGDYNDSSVAMVKKAGFLCAVTTQAGKAHPGDDPLLLPRVRMSLGQSLDQFKSMVQ